MPAPAAVIGIASGATGLLGTIYPPLGEFWKQHTFSRWPNIIPDIGTLLAMARRNPAMMHDINENAARLGISAKWVEELFLATDQRPNVTEYVKLFRRNIISETEFYDQLESLGWTRPFAELFLKVTEFFPTPQDLISFAVREVYTPATVERFGQMEDIPVQFLQEAAKAGVPDEQARNYWAAHWQLPSIMQGFEMLHRRVINQKDLNLLLKSLDVMPFWRDKLTKISYNVITRVDARRMYRVGVMDADEVFDTYQDMGYSPKDAKRLADFTVINENLDLQGISRDNILAAFKDDLITEDEMRDMLKGLLYVESVIDFWTEQAIYDKTVNKINIYKKGLIDQYRTGMLNIDDVRNRLYEFNLPGIYVERVLQDIVIAKAEYVKHVPKGDLDKWLENNIITEKEYYTKMRLLGYTEKDILKYLEMFNILGDTSERKYLGDTVYLRWFKNGIIDEPELVSTLREKGIAIEDINNLILEARGE